MDLVLMPLSSDLGNIKAAKRTAQQLQSIKRAVRVEYYPGTKTFEFSLEEKWPLPPDCWTQMQRAMDYYIKALRTLGNSTAKCFSDHLIEIIHSTVNEHRLMFQK